MKDEIKLIKEEAKKQELKDSRLYNAMQDITQWMDR